MTTDVVIIGAGPVGLTFALLLGHHGLRVAVFEQRTGPACEPRAVSLDDESLRVWQSCGLEDAIGEDVVSGDAGESVCRYLDECGDPFLRIHQRVSELGHPHAVAIHQGRIEGKLAGAAARHPMIRLHHGCTIRRVENGNERVRVLGLSATGGEFECCAPWAIACDGAKSSVRASLGISFDGVELEHRWLVANLADPDAGRSGVEIRCRPGQASVTMPLPHGLRRVEVELAGGDDGVLVDAGQLRDRLTRAWAGAKDAEIIGWSVRRFGAAVARRWRSGRVFLAGDAAHVMPPFAGQGLCSGLRDAANLSFKIAGACQGWLTPQVLDSYETERRPHVERMIRLSHRLGRVMSPGSSLEGRVVHASLRLLAGVPAIGSRWLLRGRGIQPVVRSGFIAKSRWAGRYLPQPRVLGPDGGAVRFDDLLGPRMTWIVLIGCPRSALRAPLLQPSDCILVEGRDFQDPARALRKRYGAGGIILVRPDRVVYYHARHRRGLNAQRSFACIPNVTVVREV